MEQKARPRLFNGKAIVVSVGTECDIPLQPGDVVRLALTVDMNPWIDIAETNAGAKYIPNPNTCIYPYNEEADSPFLAVVRPYDVIARFTNYKGSDLEDFLTKFDVGGSSILLQG